MHFWLTSVPAILGRCGQSTQKAIDQSYYPLFLATTGIAQQLISDLQAHLFCVGLQMSAGYSQIR